MLSLLKRYQIMKTRLNIKFATALFTLSIIANVACAEVNQNIKDWFGNHNFSFVEQNDLLVVNINKNPWEAFTLSIDNTDLMNNPVVTIEMSTEQSINVRVDISDGVFVSSQSRTIESKVDGNGMFNKISFDFTEVLNDVNLSQDAFLVFFVNPGQKFNGEVLIKNLKFSTSADESKILNNIQDELSVFPSPATSFTNVTIPDGTFDCLNFIDITGKIIAKFDIKNFCGTTHRIDLANFSKGTFMVLLVGETQSLSGKLIIN